VIPVILTERVLLALILAIGAGLRVWLLLGPFGEIDADEAVVGLMAMQVPGELPAFYWEQHYLGTIEPLVAAGLFALVGPSAAALKVVPAAFSMIFVMLVYLTARSVFGPGPALVSAIYLAVPPSFFAAWSVKARGGYPEALVLGQLCLLAAQHLADRPPTERGTLLRWSGTLGLAAGLALWTHPMSVVMVAAAGAYLLLSWRPWDRGHPGRPGGVSWPGRPEPVLSEAKEWPRSQGVGLGVAALCFLVGRVPPSTTTCSAASRACASPPRVAPSRAPHW